MVITVIMMRVILCVYSVCVLGAAELDSGFEGEHAEALKKLQLNTQQQIERIKKNVPEGYVHKTVLVPLRDGSALPAEIFTPPSDGQWPVYLMKSHYGRWAIAGYANRFYKANKERGEVVYVMMGTRRDKDAIVKEAVARDDNPWEYNDCYDAVEWCAEQAWSNGRVCMSGGSGHGVCPMAAAIASPPHLVYSTPGSSGADLRHDWTFHNGVQRGMYNWLGLSSKPYPKIREYNAEGRIDFLRKMAEQGGGIPVSTGTGWYDITIEASLDYFQAFGPKGNVDVRIHEGGHAASIKFNGKSVWAKPLPSTFKKGELASALFDGVQPQKPSKLRYFVLGDHTDKTAPGNCYKETAVWPVPHTPTAWYLHADGSVSPNSATSAGSQEFKYDPNNPVPTLGGNIYHAKESVSKKLNAHGPWDQRVLAERTDILRFVSEPLGSPLEITGKIRAVLAFESDVQDTALTVKLVDIYPDGYEAIIRDSIGMARYHAGFDTPSPLEKGTVYELDIDMWSIACVFNTGHRIGVHISSSNAPKYQIHSNLYEPVDSLTGAPIATNTIHMSPTHQSRIILPVIQAE